MSAESELIAGIESAHEKRRAATLAFVRQDVAARAERMRRKVYRCVHCDAEYAVQWTTTLEEPKCPHCYPDGDQPARVGDRVRFRTVGGAVKSCVVIGYNGEAGFRGRTSSGTQVYGLWPQVLEIERRR